jgi:hypothetical protein
MCGRNKQGQVSFSHLPQLQSISRGRSAVELLFGIQPVMFKTNLLADVKGSFFGSPFGNFPAPGQSFQVWPGSSSQMILAKKP